MAGCGVLEKGAVTSNRLMNQHIETGSLRCYGVLVLLLLYPSLMYTLKLLEKTADPYLAGKTYYLLYTLNTHWDDVKNVNKYARAATENALKTNDYNLLSNCYIALSVAAGYNYASNRSDLSRDSIIYYLNNILIFS